MCALCVQVLSKLLVVAIADTDPDIRQSVLGSIDQRFDHHLAQSENLRSLFIALNDEVFEMRVLAINIIGRLVRLNPAFVMPSLRKTLIQLLTELEFGSVSRSKEESAKLLSHLIAASPTLIKPYVDPILKALLPKLKDTELAPAVASAVLAAIGELGQVGGEDMMAYIDELMPLVIDTLQDQSSVAKREVALKALGQLVKSTGSVITPYLKYPNLLGLLLNFLKTEQGPSIRREVIKVLGILGALDPYKHKVNQSVLRDAPQNNTDAPAGIGIGAGGSGSFSSPSSSDDYYPTVTISALMRILRDPSLSTHHSKVIQVVMNIFTALGVKCVPFLPQVMPPFLHVLRTCEPHLREFLFQHLSTLVTIVKQHIRNDLDDILDLIKVGCVYVGGR